MGQGIARKDSPKALGRHPARSAECVLVTPPELWGFWTTTPLAGHDGCSVLLSLSEIADKGQEATRDGW